MYEDRCEYRERRSSNKRKQKSNRHHTKDMLNNFSNGKIDNDYYYDMMEELNDDE